MQSLLCISLYAVPLEWQKMKAEKDQPLLNLAMTHTIRMCFYDDYTPRIALAWGSTRQKKEREGEKAVKNESEERKNARERELVRSSWFWFNKNLRQERLGTLLCPSSQCQTQSHLRALRIFIFSVCSTCCELSLVFDTCVYAVVMAAGGN